MCQVDIASGKMKRKVWVFFFFLQITLEDEAKDKHEKYTIRLSRKSNDTCA